MKFTDYLVKKQTEGAHRTTSKLNEIKEVANRISEIKNMMDTFASNGDFESYNEYDKELSLLTSKLHVLRRSSEVEYITRSEALKVWSDYANEYNKEFRKQYKSYMDYIKKACDTYLKLAIMQNEALKEAEACNWELKHDPIQRYLYDESMDKLEFLSDKKANLHGASTITADTSLFEAYGLINYDQMKFLKLVARNRVHSNDIEA